MSQLTGAPSSIRNLPLSPSPTSGHMDRSRPSPPSPSILSSEDEMLIRIIKSYFQTKTGAHTFKLEAKEHCETAPDVLVIDECSKDDWLLVDSFLDKKTTWKNSIALWGTKVEYDGELGQMWIKAPVYLKTIIKRNISALQVDVLQSDSLTIDQMKDDGELELVWTQEPDLTLYIAQNEFRYVPTAALSFYQTRFPFLVVEVGISETKHHLRRKLKNYLLGSGGDVKIGIAISITRKSEILDSENDIEKATITAYGVREVDFCRGSLWVRENAIYVVHPRQEQIYPDAPTADTMLPIKWGTILDLPVDNALFDVTAIEFPLYAFYGIIKNSVKEVQNPSISALAVSKDNTSAFSMLLKTFPSTVTGDQKRALNEDEIDVNEFNTKNFYDLEESTHLNDIDGPSEEDFSVTVDKWQHDNRTWNQADNDIPEENFDALKIEDGLQSRKLCALEREAKDWVDKLLAGHITLESLEDGGN